MVHQQTPTKPLIEACEICGTVLTPSKQGRVKHYCSGKCRKEAQRRRERGDQVLQQATTERQLHQRLLTLPGHVATKLMEMKSTYGVFAAWDASEIAMLLLAEKNVTPKQSQKDAELIITMDDFTLEQQYYNAKAEQGILYATLHFGGTPKQGYTMTGLYNKKGGGGLGTKQTEQCKALLAVLEQKMSEALEAAGWQIVGTSTGGKHIWKQQKESE